MFLFVKQQYFWSINPIYQELQSMQKQFYEIHTNCTEGPCSSDHTNAGLFANSQLTVPSCRRFSKHSTVSHSSCLPFLWLRRLAEPVKRKILCAKFPFENIASKKFLEIKPCIFFEVSVSSWSRQTCGWPVILSSYPVTACPHFPYTCLGEGMHVRYLVECS